MAYTFPLPLETFFETFPISSVTFDLGESLESDETGGGEILTADVGERLWEMTVNFRLGRYAEIEALKAKLSVLRYAGRSLLVHAIPSKYPANDPDGAIMNAHASIAGVLGNSNGLILGGFNPAAGSIEPKLKSKASNNRDVSLEGLPPSYHLQHGDCMSFTVNGKYFMHQVVNVRTANAAGEITNLEVVPFIQPDVIAGTPVQLIKPTLKMVYVPNSFNAGQTGQQITTGVSVTFRQTLG